MNTDKKRKEIRWNCQSTPMITDSKEVSSTAPRSQPRRTPFSLFPVPFSVLIWVHLCSSVVASLLFAQNEDEKYRRLREEMVRAQIATQRWEDAPAVRDPRVLEAMRSVPRHMFVPPSQRAYAYDDTPLPIGHGQTISQPYMVGKMTELAQPKKDHRALEIGTGSGYQAAVLSVLVAEVYTIEIVEPLGTAAGERLRELGYRNVEVRIGDGYAGWPEKAPFDLILVTAGAREIPAPLVEQLKPGGRLVIPVGEPGEVQILKLAVKGRKGPHDLTVRDVMPVRFVPLVRSQKNDGKHR
jgi:protein-L-isoaspartate(D-aspartate) O-methyltransferase